MATKKPAEALVNRETLRRFVEDVQCKGISEVSDKEKVTQAELFENFLLELKKGVGLIVTATDTHINMVIAQHVLKEGDDVKVEVDGKIPVTNIKNFLTALSRVGGDKKGRNTQLIYPDEENRIRLSRLGTETSFSFPTEGEEKLTSLVNVSGIKHHWSKERGCVISESAKTNAEIPWPHKIVVVPAALRELAKDVSTFVKQRVSRLKVEGGKAVFALGDATASRKGGRELQPITRKVLKFEMDVPKKKDEMARIKSSSWVDADDKAENIEANYYHGFYAVVGNVDDSLATEIHWANILGGWMMWVHAENATTELNYMVPYDK